MSDDATSTGPLRTMLALAVLWTIVGVVFATEEFIAVHAFGGTVSLRRTIAYALPGWYLWAAITPLILYLARRFPIRRGSATFALLLHMTAGAIITLVHTAAAIAILQLLDPSFLNGATYQAALRMRIQFASHLDLVTYWAVIGVAHAAAFYRRQTERELQSVRLSASLAEARLQVLRMELNPHFLFNTLNAISSFVYTDPRAADRMIARLGELLRLSLVSRNQVTLAEELRLLQCYTDIERIRFGERLHVSTEASADALRALVPSLILQPLVENAVLHGMQPDSMNGSVLVHAVTIDDILELTVEDNGTGIADGAASSNGAALADGAAHANGLGLANTRARLAGLYADRARLDIMKRPGGGTIVRLRLPCERTHVD